MLTNSFWLFAQFLLTTSLAYLAVKEKISIKLQQSLLLIISLLLFIWLGLKLAQTGTAFSDFSDIILLNQFGIIIVFTLVSYFQRGILQILPLLAIWQGIILISAMIISLTTIDGNSDLSQNGIKENLGNREFIWSIAHIGISSILHGFLTLTALLGWGALIQYRELKERKKAPAYLLSMRDSDHLFNRWVKVSAVLSFVSILSGISYNFIKYNQLLIFNHKLIFMGCVFILLLSILILKNYSHISNRRIWALGLYCYICMLIGQTGVRFIEHLL